MFKKYRNEKGQSLVEFALILPILLIIVFGIIDFGWLFYNQSSLNNCAREGARFAVVNASQITAEQMITDHVLAVSPPSIKTGMVVTVVWSDTATRLQGDVTVSVKTSVKILTPLLGVFSQNQMKPISAKVTMKVES